MTDNHYRTSVDAPDALTQQWNDSALVRNSKSLIRRLRRFTEQRHAEDRDYFLRPPIIVNSFPNCGAGLMVRLAHAFPGITDYGTRISSMPTIPFRERSDMAHDRLIRRIAPGEIVTAHLFFNDSHARRIAARNGVHFFIYRDLRDLAVCEAYELTYVKFWHRLHPFFAGLRNDAERISAAIQGFSHARFPYNYPHIGHRFARYQGWLNRYDVMAVAFEDLCSGRFEEIARKVARFYADRSRMSPDEDSIVEKVRRILAAEASGMLREKAPGVWARAFTPEHCRQFEEIAGDLNRRLGYASPPSPKKTAASSHHDPRPADVVVFRPPRRTTARGG